MARPSNTAERRAQIVEALRKVLATRGYAGSTIKAIAAEAQITPGLVHYHFSSKREILLALADYIVSMVAARLEPMDAQATTARDRVYSVLEAWLGRGPGADFDTVGAWVALGAEAVHSDEVAEVYGRLVQEWIDLIEGRCAEALVEAGGDPALAPPVARTLFAFVEGTFRLAAAGPRMPRRGSAALAARSLADVLIEGGFAPGRP